MLITTFITDPHHQVCAAVSAGADAAVQVDVYSCVAMSSCCPVGVGLPAMIVCVVQSIIQEVWKQTLWLEQ